MKKTPQDSSHRRGRKDALDQIAKAISLYLRAYAPQKYQELFLSGRADTIPPTAEILQEMACEQLAESPELLSPLEQLQAAQDEAECALFAKADKKKAVFEIKQVRGTKVPDFPRPAADFEPLVRHVRFFGPLLFCSPSGPNRLLW